MSGPAPLNALRAFEAVVRSGSFAAAAGELHVTQSAISHQIKGLEQWFGAPLFDREGPRPRPLPHAQQLARSLSLGFDSINAACRAARGYSQTRPLVVAAIPSVAVCWLIPRLGSFRAAHPGVEMRIVYALHGQEIDFARSISPSSSPRARPRRAGPIRCGCCRGPRCRCAARNSPRRGRPVRGTGGSR